MTLQVECSIPSVGVSMANEDCVYCEQCGDCITCYYCGEGCLYCESKEPKMPKPHLIIDVYCCARCDDDHKDLEFLPFTNHCEQYEYYAYCPKNNQPILLSLKRE